MSLLINGMEMPKDGFITITVTSDGRVIGNSKKENGKFEYLGNEDIAKAVSVPEPHGRLIDADELYAFAGTVVADKTDRDVALDCKVKAASILREFIRRAPTIIPASEKEE